MNICVVCHYFWPEISAPSARLKEMADCWVAEGHQVTVVTNFPNHPTGTIHPGYEGRTFMEENVGGLRILRCRTYATPNSGFLKKTLSHLVFAWNAVRQARRHLSKVDVILVSSPTLFSAVGALCLSGQLRRPYIIEVRDLWPAIFVELGVLKNRLLIKLLEALELFLYRKSRHVVTVTQAFADDIARRTIPATKITVIRNGVDLTRFKPGERSSAIAEEFQVRQKFVVLYIGAHGISQGLVALLEAARRLEQDKEIQFLFIGDGADKEKLVEAARGMGLTNVSFFPGESRNRMPDLYRLSDICLVPLRNIPLFRTFIPSKMFEIMAAGKPIVASLEGEAAGILKESGAARITPPENAEAIAQAIVELKNSPEARRAMAENGRRFVERHYDRSRLARRYRELMQTVIEKV
jgi:glycosyltransferase involved in cell wall biosynthesis